MLRIKELELKVVTCRGKNGQSALCLGDGTTTNLHTVIDLHMAANLLVYTSGRRRRKSGNQNENHVAAKTKFWRMGSSGETWK